MLESGSIGSGQMDRDVDGNATPACSIGLYFLGLNRRDGRASGLLRRIAVLEPTGELQESRLKGSGAGDAAFEPLPVLPRS